MHTIFNALPTSVTGAAEAVLPTMSQAKSAALVGVGFLIGKYLRTPIAMSPWIQGSSSTDFRQAKIGSKGLTVASVLGSVVAVAATKLALSVTKQDRTPVGQAIFTGAIVSNLWPLVAPYMGTLDNYIPGQSTPAPAAPVAGSGAGVMGTAFVQPKGKTLSGNSYNAVNLSAGFQNVRVPVKGQNAARTAMMAANG